MRLVLAALVALTGMPAGGSIDALAAEPQTHAMDVRARAISRFRIGSDQIRFGALEFAGGLEMIGSSRHFGALSGITLSADQSGFLGVADTGFWIRGRIERDADGRPVSLADVEMRGMTGQDGQALAGKVGADAEAIAGDGDRIVVGFEHDHRITRYERAAAGWPAWRDSAPPPVPLHELRRNRGFEGLAFAPPASPLAGALVGVSEKSLDRAGNIMGFVSNAGVSVEFSVLRRDEYDITDIAFLPGGDLILLERRFNVQDGIGMRLRRIDGAAITEGATIDGAVMLEADMRHQIDNMEALDITLDPDGTTRLTILSDDNHSLLQRNLLIEFTLPAELRQEAGG